MLQSKVRARARARVGHLAGRMERHLVGNPGHHPREQARTARVRRVENPKEKVVTRREKVATQRTSKATAIGVASGVSIVIGVANAVAVVMAVPVAFAVGTAWPLPSAFQLPF